MRVRRLWPVLLLAPLGMVAGHQVVYAALHSHSSTVAQGHPHGHLALLTALALPLAAAGAAWLAPGAGQDARRPALATLASAQVLAFAVMEAGERLAAGGDVAALVRSPLLWGGLGAQVALALAVGLTLGGAGRVATALLLRTTSVMGSTPPAVPGLGPTGERVPRPLALTRWLSRRGPPGLLVS